MHFLLLSFVVIISSRTPINNQTKQTMKSEYWANKSLSALFPLAKKKTQIVILPVGESLSSTVGPSFSCVSSFAIVVLHSYFISCSHRFVFCFFFLILCFLTTLLSTVLAHLEPAFCTLSCVYLWCWLYFVPFEIFHFQPFL